MFIPVISALCGVTLLPIILAFILAMLSTGYSRDILYFYHITKCTGALFTTTVSTRVVNNDIDKISMFVTDNSFDVHLFPHMDIVWLPDQWYSCDTC